MQIEEVKSRTSYFLKGKKKVSLRNFYSEAIFLLHSKKKIPSQKRNQKAGAIYYCESEKASFTHWLNWRKKLHIKSGKHLRKVLECITRSSRIQQCSG